MKGSEKEAALSGLDDSLIVAAALPPQGKRISAQRTLAGKLALAMLGLWLLAMLLLTVSFAADLRRQGEGVCTSALAASLTNARTEWANGAEKLPALNAVFTPVSGLPLSLQTEVRLWKGSLTVNPVGIAVHSEGFAIGSAAEPNTGLTVKSGRLSFIMSPGFQTGWGAVEPYGERTPTSYHYKGVATNGKLTFEDAPQWRGSFPSAEFDGDFPEEGGRYSATAAVNPGNQTSAALLDGIDSGEYRFGSGSLLVSTYLRGAWLPDRDGAGRSFVIVAYGWSPLRTAVKMLPCIYLSSLALFLLTGMLIFLTFRRTLLTPLLRLGQTLKAAPMEVTDKEFDFTFRYQEIQDVTAFYLLRRQMQAAQNRPAPTGEGEVSVPAVLDRVGNKVFPILLDRSLKLHRKELTDGRVPATEEKAEKLLLALFHEAFSYAAPDQTLYFTLSRQHGFVLAELSFTARHRISDAELSLLWNGVYRQPANLDAPGAKLRTAIASLPGSFCAVRKTKKGIVLTAGLPVGNGTGIAPAAGSTQSFG